MAYINTEDAPQTSWMIDSYIISHDLLITLIPLDSDNIAFSYQC